MRTQKSTCIQTSKQAAHTGTTSPDALLIAWADILHRFLPLHLDDRGYFQVREDGGMTRAEVQKAIQYLVNNGKVVIDTQHSCPIVRAVAAAVCA